MRPAVTCRHGTAYGLHCPYCHVTACGQAVRLAELWLNSTRFQKLDTTGREAALQRAEQAYSDACAALPERRAD